MFYSLRFLLGVFEAGFFPGIILYLTYWFPSLRRAKIFGMFMCASAFAGVIGGPMAGAILNHLSGVHGWAGWQWLFLIEGIPSVIAGVVTLFYLTDKPEKAIALSEGGTVEDGADAQLPGPRALAILGLSAKDCAALSAHANKRLGSLQEVLGC